MPLFCRHGKTVDQTHATTQAPHGAAKQIYLHLISTKCSNIKTPFSALFIEIVSGGRQQAVLRARTVGTVRQGDIVTCLFSVLRPVLFSVVIVHHPPKEITSAKLMQHAGYRKHVGFLLDLTRLIRKMNSKIRMHSFIFKRTATENMIRYTCSLQIVEKVQGSKYRNKSKLRNQQVYYVILS